VFGGGEGGIRSGVCRSGRSVMFGDFNDGYVIQFGIDYTIV
jgi:hypothetical protein